jgi:ABC-type nitrate/sulfonate/bicarbonate transport system permease component
VRTPRPIASFPFPTPKVALYTAMLIVFGLGSASKVAFGFSEAVFPIVVAAAAGTSRVEQRLVWSAASLAVIAISLIGYVLDRGFLLIRSRALAWSAEERF